MYSRFLLRVVPIAFIFTVAALLGTAGESADPAAAWDAGTDPCIHDECTGGVQAGYLIESNVAFGEPSAPDGGRAADCPDGYTNTGVVCTGTFIPVAPVVAECPDGYDLVVATCIDLPDFTDTTAPGCPTGYSLVGESFGDFNAGSCYYVCPSGYTTLAVGCEPDPLTLGLDYMTCAPGEFRYDFEATIVCYPTDTCGDGDFWIGLCYPPCPDGSARVTLPTNCESTPSWRGNTHLWVVNRSLDLLAQSPDPSAQNVAQIMNEPACRWQWEQGVWDGDSPTYVDDPMGATAGSHFYNAAGKDIYGDATNAITYKLGPFDVTSEFGPGTQGTARTNADSWINQIDTLDGSAIDCWRFGLALHYLTDVTTPMHAASFSGGDLPLWLHPVYESYVPLIQGQFPVPPSAAWDEAGKGASPDAIFHAVAFNTAGAGPALIGALSTDTDNTCAMTPDTAAPHVTYVGDCFLGDPDVINVTGAILGNGYQGAASYIYSVVDLYRDIQPPAAAPSFSPLPNIAGWNNADVTATWNWSDAESGINLALCPATTVSNFEGAGQLVGTCQDLAGNTGSATHNLKVDKTAPSASAAASPSPNANGWNNTNVTVTYTGTDSVSGIDSCTVPAIMTTDGAGQTSPNGTCTDLAGNVSAPVNVSDINIDQSAPTLSVDSVVSVADGLYPSETLGSFPATVGASSVSLNGSVSDLSGVVAVTVNGLPANYDDVAGSWSFDGIALALGSNSFTIAATDLADNVTSFSVDVSFDTDLDADGIANNVDGSCDGVTGYNVAGNFGFSDLQLGGLTCGDILEDGGHTVTVTDAPDPATGLHFVVDANVGPDAEIQLADKASTISLATGSSADITDPDATTTIDVETGQATVRLLMVGVPVVIVIDEDTAVTFTETTNEEGTVFMLMIDVDLDAGGVVTFNGDPIVGVVTYLGPTHLEQCRRGGSDAFNFPREFRNTGDCVAFTVVGRY